MKGKHFQLIQDTEETTTVQVMSLMKEDFSGKNGWINVFEVREVF